MSENISRARLDFAKTNFSDEKSHIFRSELLKVRHYPPQLDSERQVYEIEYNNAAGVESVFDKTGAYWIEWIAVDDELSGQGIATDLYLAAAAHASLVGADSLRARLIDPASARAAEKAFGEKYIEMVPIDENGYELDSVDDEKFDHVLPYLDLPLSGADH